MLSYHPKPSGGSPSAAELHVPYATTLSLTTNNSVTSIIDTVIPRDFSIYGATALATFLPTGFNSSGAVTINITGAALSEASVRAILLACVNAVASGGSLDLSGGTSWSPPIQAAAITQVETVLITAIAGSGVNNNEVIQFYTPDANAFYVWFNLDGSGSDPGGTGTSVPVLLNTNDSTSTIAGAIASAINFLAGGMASASAFGDEVTVTQVLTGVCTDASTSSAGLSLAVAADGADTVQFADIETLLSGGWTVSTN